MKKALIMMTILVGMGIVLLPAWMRYAQGDEYSEGKSLFEEKCRICHGADGKGDGPAAPALNPRPSDFTNPKFWQGDVDKKIAKTIRNGHPPMPAFQLKESEIRALIVYLRHSFKKM
jgi:mono/diheme cytochrome c family protein